MVYLFELLLSLSLDQTHNISSNPGFEMFNGSFAKNFNKYDKHKWWNSTQLFMLKLLTNLVVLCDVLENHRVKITNKINVCGLQYSQE